MFSSVWRHVFVGVAACSRRCGGMFSSVWRHTARARGAFPPLDWRVSNGKEGCYDQLQRAVNYGAMYG